MPTPKTPSQVYLVYIDESYDPANYCYSAIFVPIFKWNFVFQQIQTWRYHLEDDYGIPVDHELHATDFVAGKSHPNSNRDKAFRGNLFREAFTVLENISDIMIMNAFTTNKTNHMMLFEWMLNRINRTLEAKDACGILVCDEGNEKKLISMVRTMKKANTIPDAIDRYGYNNSSRDIPISRIIEDPLFKQSHMSYLIQMADFVAYGLLRNERPTPSTHPIVQSAFEILDNVLLKVAFKNDPRKKGIIRV